MNKIYILIASSFIALSAQAQIMTGVDTAADYLMVTDEQQEIYLGRYLNANKDIASQCQPGWPLAKSNDYFVSWVNNHPQYLRRSLTTSFSAALLESCKTRTSK